MTRDTTEQPAARSGNGTKAEGKPGVKQEAKPPAKPAAKSSAKPTASPVVKPAGKPAGKPNVSPVPRTVAPKAADASTPADGTPGTTSSAKAASSTAAPPKISPTTPRTSTPAAARPAETKPVAGKKPAAGPRRVRLAVSRVDPWSVMKLSFLLSIAIGIMIVVATVVFWFVLDGLHVFTGINDMVVTILGEDSTKTDLLQYVELQRFVSLSTIIAIVDVVLLTALSTIGAFLYNVVAALVGGVHLTLTDE